MKKILLLFFTTLQFSFVFSQAPSWVWARQGIGALHEDDEGYEVSMDNAGNVFLTGNFQDSIRFGKFLLANPTNENNVFLAKYDSTGNILWASQSNCGLSSSGYGYSVATDPSGNSYVTGNFVDSLFFKPFTLLDPGGSSMVFLAKYNASGHIIWAKQSTSSTGLGYAYSVATDKLGNIYIAGNFGLSLTFGSIILNGINSTGYAFLAKYDSAGNVIWAKQSKGGSNVVTYSIASDLVGNIYITGDFCDTVSFGTFKLNAPHNISNIFIVKYDSKGNELWARQSTKVGAYSDGIGLTIDNTNHMYLTGDFRGSVTFDTRTLTSVYGDIYLNKYDSAGNLIWAKEGNILDSTNWSGYSITVDTIGNVYLAGGKLGGTYGEIVFDCDTLSVVRKYEVDPAIIIKFDSSGNYLSGSIISSGGDDNNGIITDPSGKHVYLGGDLWSGVNFGPDSLGTAPQISEWPFIARWEAGKANPCSSLGVNQIEPEEPKVTVYPNPTNGIFSINTTSISGEKRIELYNILGEKIYESTNSSTPVTQINLNKNPSGVYLYRIITEKGNWASTGKFIIVK